MDRKGFLKALSVALMVPLLPMDLQKAAAGKKIEVSTEEGLRVLYGTQLPEANYYEIQVLATGPQGQKFKSIARATQSMMENWKKDKNLIKSMVERTRGKVLRELEMARKYGVKCELIVAPSNECEECE